MMNQTPQPQRAHPREPVSFAAYWNDGMRSRTGEIRDISRFGMFLSPAWRPNTSYLPGDEIDVRLQCGDIAMDVKTIVRWTGNSEAHGCEGLGLQVVSPTQLEPLLHRVRAA